MLNIGDVVIIKTDMVHVLTELVKMTSNQLFVNMNRHFKISEHIKKIGCLKEVFYKLGHCVVRKIQYELA